MSNIKENDIRMLCQQFRENGTSQRERKIILSKIEKLVNDANSFDELCISWETIMKQTISPIFTKNERGEIRNMASLIISSIGVILLQTTEFEQFLVVLKELYHRIHKKSDENKAEVVYCVYHCIGVIRQLHKKISDVASVEKALDWIIDIIPNASSSVYTQCIKGIILISNVHPEVFNENFEKTIEVLIQNLPEASSHEKNTILLSDTLEGFHDIFASKPHFLEKLPPMILTHITDSTPIQEARRRFRVTLALARLTGSGKIINMVNDTLSSIWTPENETSPKKTDNFTLFSDVFKELLLISKNDEESILRIEESLHKILDKVHLCNLSLKEEQAFFKFLAKSFQINATLPTQSNIKAKVIKMVFDENTGLFSAGRNQQYAYGFNHMYREIVELLSILLNPTSLPHLQATYSDMRIIMLDCVKNLTNEKEKLSSNEIRVNECKLMLLLSSLVSINTAKSSLIVMMGIRPTIFELFIQEMPLTDYKFAVKHPEVYHLLVEMLVAHLKSHDYYVEHSDYIVKWDNSPIGQTKRDFTRRQIVALEVIVRCFKGDMMDRTRKLISSWIWSIVEQAESMNIGKDEYQNKEWVKLRSTLMEKSTLDWNNERINMTIAKLQTVTTWPETNPKAEYDHAEQMKKMPWKDAAAVWEAGDSKVYIRQSVSGVYQMAQETQQKVIPSTTFGAEEFTVVTNFLLNSTVPSTFKKGTYTWMDEMLDTMIQGCSNMGEKKGGDQPEKFMDKWRWVIGQTANYCIINKMKTPLGKAMQTFQAISLEVNKLAKEVLNHKGGKEKTKTGGDEGEKGSLRYTIQWLRVRLLLEFVDILDKMMTSAVNGGSSLALYDISQSSRQFFITNQQSCNEWLHRLYYSAVVVSYFNGDYGMAIRFGWNGLLVFQKRERDEKAVSIAVLLALWMCLAMAELSEPISVSGLRTWMRSEFETENGQNIMEALEAMANSRYEAALYELGEILKNDATLSETYKLICNHSMTDILARLRIPIISDYYKEQLYPDETEVSEDFKSLEMLSKFDKIPNFNEKRGVLDWCAKDKLMAIEAGFTQTMRKFEIATINKDLKSMGALALNVDTNCRLYSNVASTNLIISSIVDRINNQQSKNNIIKTRLFEDSDQWDVGEKLTICRKVFAWSRHLKNQRGNSNEANAEIIRLARKTENKQLAFTHMNTKTNMDTAPWMRLEITRQNMKLMKMEPFEMQCRNMNELFGALIDLHMDTCTLRANFDAIVNENPDENCTKGLVTELTNRDEVISRSCIQLAEFLNDAPEIDNIIMPHFGNSLLWRELENRSSQLGFGCYGIVGALFNFAADNYPMLSKAHLKFAHFAYEMSTARSIATSDPNLMQITFGSNPKENEDLWKCLEATTAGQLEKEIRKVMDYDQKKILQLLAPNGPFLTVWNAVFRTKSAFLSYAAASYFNFIRNMSGQHPYSKKEETVSATLRILDLLVRHGDILIDVLDNGLATTDVHIWKEILPQLFARLSHPSEHIRNTLVNLIAMICKAAPHAVVFQVVSGASSSQVDLDELEVEKQNDDRNKVRDCCEQLEKNLAQSYPSLVRDVRLFIAELERINLLNEEKWSVVLGTMEHEMERRLVLIRAENNKTAQASHLSDVMKEKIMIEKTHLMTIQIFDVLDELYERTCMTTAATENEKQFQTVFGEQLAAAFVESKLNRGHPEKSWAPFKNLIADLVHRNMKKGMQTYETQTISPYLAALSQSCVPMPGQESVEFDRVVSIARVAKNVTVLPTKTRPKKLGFVGSDGKQYAFLFKGREDLHLDERVMQFLRLCNVMLNSGKSNRSVAQYQANNYAVIPLGPRSGLIKWVEGATPLFHIYRKWQLREKQLRQVTKKNGETVADIERPTEMYHRLIRQAFVAHKVDASIASDRSKWPLNVLREVHGQLLEKTPRDLLSRELWIRSGCATTWWKTTSRYAKSCAVMSMVGSVLGLGDRHLDNLLVDLTKGHVIHIDYNICFDKGRNLRIPETVPFRMTQNMAHALGPGHVQGAFRESCRHVLSRLRDGKQVLTMLLDAFVFDPLVDWTSHEHSAASGISLALQLAVYGSEWKQKARESVRDNVAMFRLRMTELGSHWTRNREELRQAIQCVSEILRVHKSYPGINGVGTGVYDAQRVEAGSRLYTAVTNHQVLIKEVRSLIRLIGKHDETFAEYYKFYKQSFSDPLVKGHKALADDLNLDIDACLKHFGVLLTNIDGIYSMMLNLGLPTMDQQRQQYRMGAPPGLENVWVVKEDQVENTMARAIVRSVEKRLEGYSTNESKLAMTPQEQADEWISEATNISNLATMYEGWTAWV